MEYTGYIIKIKEARGGTSPNTGKNWMVQNFVLEIPGQYPKHLCFEVFGEDRIKEFNIQMGEEMTVKFDVDAREYKGEYYTQIRAYAVEKTGKIVMISRAESSENG